MSGEKSRWADYLQRWLEVQTGLGLILFFWLLITALLGGLVLLTLGMKLWNPWWFLLGMMSLRLFAWLTGVGEATVRRYFS